jgi:formate dehydrogenase
VVKEGEPDIAPLTIRVCDSLTCAMMGAEKLLHELQDKSGPGIRVVRAPCVGFCDSAPVAEVGHRYVLNATSSEVLDTAARGETHPIIPSYVDYETYVSRGGSARKTFSRFWTTPACGDSAAPAFPPAANGGQCWASQVRG